MRSAQELAAARSIWPTGKPARQAYQRDEVVALLARDGSFVSHGRVISAGRLYVEVTDCIVGGRYLWAPERTVPARTRGIAEGRRLARERHRRFMEWLRDCPVAHFVALDHARNSLSPEHAVAVAAADGFLWPFVATEWGVQCRRDADPWDWAALGVELLASPEWAALPWQREAP